MRIGIEISGESPDFEPSKESKQHQREIVLKYFQENRYLPRRIAEDVLFVMSPAARVHELRQMGHRINTLRDETRCAVYEYLGIDEDLIEEDNRLSLSEKLEIKSQIKQLQKTTQVFKSST